MKYIKRRKWVRLTNLKNWARKRVKGVGKGSNEASEKKNVLMSVSISSNQKQTNNPKNSL